LKDKLHKKIQTKFRDERKKIRGGALAKNKQIGQMLEKFQKFHSVERKRKSTTGKNTIIIESDHDDNSTSNASSESTATTRLNKTIA
jgi:hypothetical protein